MHALERFAAVAAPKTGARIFNVLDYDASANNGTTNAGTGIQSAYNAARSYSVGGSPSVVLMPPGVYYVTSGCRLSRIRSNDWYGNTNPTYHQKGNITFSGYGATILYPAAGTTRYSWLWPDAWPTVIGNTYGNFMVEGLTIDTAYRQPSGVTGMAFWMSGRANLHNVLFKDVRMLRHITHYTTAPSNGSWGFSATLEHESINQTNYSYVTDITLLNSDFCGQAKPIGIYSPGIGTDTVVGPSKILYDNITIDGCSADSFGHISSNAHIGSYGTGGRWSFVRSSFTDSRDDGLEVNAADSTLIEDCEFSDCRQPICHTRFSLPYGRTASQSFIVRNANYSGNCLPYSTQTDNRSPFYEVRHYTGYDFASAGLSWGDFLMEDCDFEYGVTNDYVTQRPPYRFNEASRLSFDNVTIRNSDVTAVGPDGYIVDFDNSGTTPANFTLTGMRWRNSLSNSFTGLTAGRVSLYGNYNLTTDISGLS